MDIGPLRSMLRLPGPRPLRPSYVIASLEDRILPLLSSGFAYPPPPFRLARGYSSPTIHQNQNSPHPVSVPKYGYSYSSSARVSQFTVSFVAEKRKEKERHDRSSLTVEPWRSRWPVTPEDPVVEPLIDRLFFALGEGQNRARSLLSVELGLRNAQPPYSGCQCCVLRLAPIDLCGIVAPSTSASTTTPHTQRERYREEDRKTRHRHTYSHTQTLARSWQHFATIGGRELDNG
ncbi:hypothetical protein SODALDRAFT_332324 [Sodiomyces alkalinus F11]|uniref:Uncharacterized protein n=1 Tax=Sodiomyces alkalinus (strain CBS 110278 / VKM F-3762 / F11) TaxID=1314773 RepID=A0A3N2PX15_SODAK|nr:hypothetical protein SODALDRAFT_332324 [Sodiomyces alkalinus F11]ROT38885.1 hypothetical protein SODALDRAFT_332324 [Sodiomyces alkalinus F11]